MESPSLETFRTDQTIVRSKLNVVDLVLEQKRKLSPFLSYFLSFSFLFKDSLMENNTKDGIKIVQAILILIFYFFCA